MIREEKKREQKRIKERREREDKGLTKRIITFA